MVLKRGPNIRQNMLMKNAMCFQEAMPLRLKEVHFVNQPFLFNMVWQMFKPFVKDKLKKRVNTSSFSIYWGC
jgi:hypothetical protein